MRENTVIIYLRADDETEQRIIERSVSAPKPMYYQGQFLDTKLGEFIKLKGLNDASELEPDSFAQWMFPQLVAHRRPCIKVLQTSMGIR